MPGYSRHSGPALSLIGPSARTAGAATSGACFVVRLVSLIVFLYELLAAPATKGRFVEQPWHRPGLETLGGGGMAALPASYVGHPLQHVAGIVARPRVVSKSGRGRDERH